MNRSWITMDRRKMLAGLGAISLTTLAGVNAAAAADANDVALKMNIAELTRQYRAKSKVTMNRGGGSRVRELEIAVKRQGESALSQRRFQFTSPSDISGTALLIRENQNSDSDTWLYLPAAGRTRRIASSNQSGAFAGTDFSYADLMIMQLAKYTHAIMGQSGNSVQLESVVNSPRYARSIGYSKVVTSLNRSSFIPSQVDYFDLKGRHIKTQTMSSATRTPDGRVILRNRTMQQVGSASNTKIEISNIDFGASISDADLTPERLTTNL